MNALGYIVRTWTAGEQDFQEEIFLSEAKAIEFADGSRSHGYEAEIREKQPDLFGAAA